MTSPSNCAFGSMMSRITDIIVTLLPEPDSPTMPRVSPSETLKETPSTARTTPSSVRKLTLRSLTSSSGSLMTLSQWRPPIWPPSGGPHSRIEPGVCDIDDRIGEDDEERAVDDGCHDRRQVEVRERLIGQEADPVDREHHLRKQRAAADQDAKIEPEEADECDHRIAQRMPHQHPSLGQA